MPTNLDYFYFDVNYGLGTDSVFTLIDRIEPGTNPPPPEGFFQLLNGQDFLLLNGQHLALL
jgi:hypothetical protein